MNDRQIIRRGIKTAIYDKIIEHSDRATDWFNASLLINLDINSCPHAQCFIMGRMRLNGRVSVRALAMPEHISCCKIISSFLPIGHSFLWRHQTIPFLALTRECMFHVHESGRFLGCCEECLGKHREETEQIIRMGYFVVRLGIFPEVIRPVVWRVIN